MKNKNNQNHFMKTLLITVSVILCIVLAVFLLARIEPEVKDESSVSTENTKQTVYTTPVETNIDPIELEEGLVISAMSEYTGIYMEDGSDETVSGVMMVVLTNHTDEDLQYAQITVSFEEGDRHFDVTNLPSGCSAVILEKERLSMLDSEPISSDIENVVYFSEPMSTNADQILISGVSGIMNVQNVSGQDLDGDIYVYYKYYESGYYYGGITFRVKVEGGLSAGEVRQLSVGHYDPDRCEIVMITTGN